MQHILYAITSIDSNQEKVILNKKLLISSLSAQPFYQSSENARKAIVTMTKMVNYGPTISGALYWKEAAENRISKIKAGTFDFQSSNPKEVEILFAETQIKHYFDLISFRDIGFSISEVNLQI